MSEPEVVTGSFNARFDGEGSVTLEYGSEFLSGCVAECHDDVLYVCCDTPDGRKCFPTPWSCP